MKINEEKKRKPAPLILETGRFETEPKKGSLELTVSYHHTGGGGQVGGLPHGGGMVMFPH